MAATGATMPRARWSPATSSRPTAALSPSARITISSSRPSSAPRGCWSVGARGSQLPITRVTTGGANYPDWAGNRLSWSLGPTLYGANASDLLRNAPGGTAYSPPATGTSLSMTVPADVPTGWIALVGARDRHHGQRRGRHHRRRRDPDRRQPHPRSRPARLGRHPGRRARRSTSPARPSSPA